MGDSFHYTDLNEVMHMNAPDPISVGHIFSQLSVNVAKGMQLDPMNFATMYAIFQVLNWYML
jgi:hypothetical protein